MKSFTVTKKFAALTAAGVAVPLVLFFTDFALIAFIVYNAVLLAACVIDYLTLPRAGAFVIRRVNDRPLYYKAKNEIVFIVKNNSRKKIFIELCDDAPVTHFNSAKGNMARLLSPGEEAELSYETLPHKRGMYIFRCVYVRYRKAAGLSGAQYEAGPPAEIKVYPNLSDLGAHRLLMIKNRLLKSGERSMPLSGAGTEFESLREYVSGDDYRRINWPATARERHPVMNQYETERNQPVFIMVDAGRAMSYSLRGYKKLDYAINAALILADVVNASGDNSGLIVFSDEIHNVVMPGRGEAHKNALAEALYRTEGSKKTSDYEGAFRELITRQKRRGLAFIFTDFETDFEATDLAASLPYLNKRHTPVVVLMENESVNKLTAINARTMREAYVKGLAAESLSERARLIRQINRSGALCVETGAERFATEAVNRYLKLHSSRRL